MLDKITAAIESNAVFDEGARGPKQIPVKYQLMVLLHFLGREGETNDSQRQMFRTGSGANQFYRDRVVRALNDLRREYVQWPNEEERREIASRIEKSFHFPNCIGLMDGTLLPLAFQPASDDYADYHGRKFPYSLTVLVINDDRRRIRAYLSGYPGSTHDNRLWRNIRQNKNPAKYFSTQEYILCDTAFEPSDICVPAYKTDAGFHQSPEKIKFNNALSRRRVITEHTMGLWKGRFPWLRSIRMRITNNPISLKKILKYVSATVVLHNMIIEIAEDDNDDESLPWDINDEEISEIGDTTRVPERDLLDYPVPPGSLPGTRREQLMNYIYQTWFWVQNGFIASDDSMSFSSENLDSY